jgi:hypothetical protein
MELNNQNITYKSDTLFTVEETIFKRRNYIEIDDNGWIKNYNKYYNNVNPVIISTINSKGVCQLNYSGEMTDSTIFGINFTVPEEV